MSDKDDNISPDYIAGRNDCRAGREHEPEMSSDYDAGYARQYEQEQKDSEC